jgi:hypothetical protein
MNELFDEYESVTVDEDDIRWGLAIPANWMPRKRYGMTDKQKELYARTWERRHNKGESK